MAGRTRLEGGHTFLQVERAGVSIGTEIEAV
ncbi:MAG: hypothetical protein K0Q67_2152, partial [Cellvibrio sp.]|nr:hypothetical protein [Cellvibrio sp.]